MMNISTMEGRFEKIVMESALKMASMTNANVFVLIESENKRYFGGKRHLCEAYSIGGLLPTSTDVNLQVDPDSSCLKPKSPHELGMNSPEKRQYLNSHYLAGGNHGMPPPPPMMSPESWAVQPFPPATTTTTSSPFTKLKKRKSPNNGDHHHLLSKRPKTEIMSDNLFAIKAEMPEDDDGGPNGSRAICETGQASFDDGNRPGFDHPSHSGFDSSQPFLDAQPFLDSSQPAFDVSDDDDDDVDLVYDNFVDGGLAEGEIKRERDDGYLSLPQDLDYLDHTQWIYDRLQEDEKTLKKLNDTRALTDMDQLRGSDSVRRKEVLSVFYALGSRFARACNLTEETYDPKYHRALFERVWTMFPNFQAHATMNISRNTGRLGCLISRCRDSFLAPFR